MTFVAVVLAGGSSRRFGMDKLDAQLTGRLNGGRLLEEVVTGLSRDAEIVVVGPERPLPHPVCFVREDPPGGGPAAAMVVGVRAALARAADTIAVLPGDAPEAGAAATVLNRVLRDRGVAAVVATDAEGRVQPLQLALSRAGAGQLIDRAGPTAGRHESARRLVEGLKPPALRWPLPAIGHFDIDTTEQLRVYRFSRSAEVEEVLAAVDRALSTPSIDTPSIEHPVDRHPVDRHPVDQHPVDQGPEAWVQSGDTAGAAAHRGAERTRTVRAGRRARPPGAGRGDHPPK